MSFMTQDSTVHPTEHTTTLEALDEEEEAASSCPSENLEENDAENENEPDTEKDEESSRCQKNTKQVIDFYWAYQFPLHLLMAILLARAYPPLGAEYLHPEITATWIAVAIIFVLAGLGLKTDEFSKAFKRLYFNSFVQFYNFGFVSITVFAVSRFLTAANMLNEALADGMVICASLPMAINVVIVLCAATGADEAAAIFNATFGNILGIFLSPVLILAYLGTTGDISLGEVFYKLTLRVVVPLITGHLIQKFSSRVRDFFKKHKRSFKKVQESCLVFIVYTVFCRTFLEDAGAGIGNVFLMILYQFLLMVSLMGIAWYSLRFFFHDEPELRVMGVFGCVQKTISLGVPLISSMYEGDPNVGLYTLPILIWHPMQLVVGSALVPRLTEFIKVERERLDGQNQGNEKTNVTDIESQGSGDDDAVSHGNSEGDQEET